MAAPIVYNLLTTVRKNVIVLNKIEKSVYIKVFKKNLGKYKRLQGYMITKEYDKLVQTRRLLGYRLEQAPAV